MNLYRLEYTINIRNGEHSEDVGELFEGIDDSAAITEANNRIPEGATSKKLYAIGIEVALE